jgi:hypothetical protein
MVSFFTCFLAILGLAGLADAKSSAGNSMLVIVETTHQDNFTRFFNGLKGKLEVCSSLLCCTVAYLRLLSLEHGYDLTFREPKALKPLVIEYDVPSFSHVILFASGTKSKK